MRRRRQFWLVAAALALVLLVCGTAAGRASVGPGPAVDATNRLALSLLPDLNPGANAVFSPYSIETALAMVDQGAGPVSAAGARRVLGAGPSRLAWSNAALSALLTAAIKGHGPHSPRLTSANGLWIQSGLSLDRSFAMSLAHHFGAPPAQVDFSHAPETALQAINGWVSSHTGRLIPQLLPAGSITPSTQLVLANALWLHARWQTPFRRQLTTMLLFHPPSARAVRAQFMTMGEPVVLPYADGTGYRAVDLPYLDSTLSLLAILPRAGTLRSFERSLSTGSLAQLVASLKPTPVTLLMPKLDLNLQSDLSPLLSSAGFPLGGYNAITPHATLPIAAVDHDAVLKVAEAGTVAGASTGIIMPGAGEPIRTSPLTLNHPFLVFLRDDRTGAILFAGRVDNPLVS
jgi:serpin B